MHVRGNALKSRRDCRSQAVKQPQPHRNQRRWILSTGLLIYTTGGHSSYSKHAAIEINHHRPLSPWSFRRTINADRVLLTHLTRASITDLKDSKYALVYRTEVLVVFP